MPNDSNLTEQLERRKRINRMKKGILTFLTTWILIVSVVLVFLVVQIFRMQHQISILASNQLELSQMSAGVTYDGEDSMVQSTEAAPAPSASAAPTVEIATLDEANLAQPGDPLKVYLTFDDGPSSNTAEILDILDKYGVKATFFVIGKEDEESQKLYQRIVEEGHTLGMHSFSHQYSTIYSSLESFEDDFYHLQSYLKELTGVESTYYRFPGSSSNQISNTDMGSFISFLDENGVTYYDWNVSSGDATTQAYTKEEIVDHVLNDVVKYKTSIVLLHDSNAKTITVEALAPLIEGLQAMGAEILPIDQNTYPVQYTVLSKDNTETTEAADTKEQEAEPAEAQPEEDQPKEQENENQIQE
ncbi:MAG: polysaccharide deacetylase [Lachnospiraceae bacterium]|nr:polysaccharide deacetylase [Lachnospiraceae bacterium]